MTLGVQEARVGSTLPQIAMPKACVVNPLPSLPAAKPATAEEPPAAQPAAPEQLPADTWPSLALAGAAAAPASEARVSQPRITRAPARDIPCPGASAEEWSSSLARAGLAFPHAAPRWATAVLSSDSAGARVHPSR